jgi:hypothetical protein
MMYVYIVVCYGCWALIENNRGENLVKWFASSAVDGKHPADLTSSIFWELRSMEW